ncbi:MAG: hypothetical protein OEZ58_16130, partial [Gammaproteobacteria bacterium]|nr:hypothetical protein [Gammaproteobacteria bacterium]
MKPQDSDGDGVADIEDDFPQDASRDSDTDGDGIADIVYILDPTGNRTNQIDEALSDSDDDGDGVSDADDRFPLNRVESEDTDNDGVGNNADLDDDNDGYNDLVDAFPLDNLEFRDSDLDGIGNRFDADDDNDGILDEDDDSLTSIVANDSYSRVIVDSTRNQIYFTFKEKKTVSVFDSRTLVEISSIRFPEMPESIAFSRDHNSLYIALLEHEHLSSRQIEDQKGYIAEIDLTSLEVKRRFHVNIDPLNLAITTSGKIIVASGSGGRKNVHVYSLSDGSFVDSLENPFSDMSQYTMDSNGEAFYVLTMNNVIKYKITDDKISYAGSLFQKNHANSADIYYSAKHNYVITQDGRVFQTSDNPKKALALIIDLTKDSSDSILSLTFDDVNNLVIVQTDARIDYYQAVTFELIRSESQSGLRNIFTDGVSLFGFSVHSQLSSDQTVLTELAHRCPRCASNTAPKVKVNIEPTGMLTPESQVSFNLGESTDEQDSLSELLISWDIDADGTWDVDYTSDKTFTKQYPYAGTKYLRVKM